ncbi:MAG TPA: CRISPR-associated protein Csx15 [Chloroflexota bacterium]|nr:CRISPR-associated protein Csx15 [Chloroflexota bacterium]
MIVLNFAHPLTARQQSEIAALLGEAVERVVEVASQVDVQQPLAPQAAALADACGLSAAEWQTLPLLVNPPSLNFLALALLAELHGRCGYFPAHLRLRPVQRASPPRYEVAEVLDLQPIRDGARQRRG